MDCEENKDAEELKKATQGFRRDDDILIEIAGKRNYIQRMKIRQAYCKNYGKDLLAVLNSELSGEYRKAMLALFTDPIEYDVESLYNALEGIPIDEDTLIEILTSRPGWYLNKIKEKYKKKYKKELEYDIKKETSSNFNQILISLLQCNRRTNQIPDENECENIANELYKIGEDSNTKDDSIFNKYLCLYSPHELLMIAKKYYKLTGNIMTKGIDKLFSGEIKKLLKTILYAQISPSEYFATRIKDALSGLEAKEEILTRIIITRVEIDLPMIKQYYKQLYGKDMMADIEDNIYGEYKKLLVTIGNQ